MDFFDIVEKFGETIDGAGVIVVIVGALIAFAGAVIGLTRHEADVYRRLRERLGHPQPSGDLKRDGATITRSGWRP